MKKVKSIKKLDKEYEAIKTIVSGDTKFIAEAMYFLCYRIDSFVTFEKRLKLLLSDIEATYGAELNPKELFEKRFPEYFLN